MKNLAIIFLFIATIVITTVSEAQDIPSSTRSRAAISRVKPKLQREFLRAGFDWGTPIFVRIFKKTKELEIWLKDRTNFKLFIFPFRMTDKNLNKHKYSEWYKFWKNLKEGYDFFEKNGHNPPNVKVKKKQYVFEPS